MNSYKFNNIINVKTLNISLFNTEKNEFIITILKIIE